ncbi:unnamed protein product [Prorocentrum cordatum]|uniref:Uncharacterized protein n=1 Tax=Prorocentrum cordatum TaxID=2364126 RepID=A0ABN9WK65_9DINO|nr:unnamed protein product [Polarella glacialis]
MSVSTTPAETLAEKAKRMREELLKDTSDITTPTETPAEVESMARDEFLKELAAETTTAPETREEMKARMKADMLRKLEEAAQKEKQNMEADVMNELHDELSKGTVDAMGD